MDYIDKAGNIEAYQTYQPLSCINGLYVCPLQQLSFLSIFSCTSAFYNSSGKKYFSEIYTVRSACKLRARRTEYKSVFFSYDINCWRKIGAYLA